MADEKTPGRTKARLAVLAIFILGFIAGGLAMNLYQKRDSNEANRPRGTRHDPVEMMKSQLNLTADQEQKVKAILSETFEEYGKIREDIHPRFDAVRQKSRERIRAVLTQEQLPKYEKMIEEADKRREKMHGGSPGWRTPEGSSDKHDKNDSERGEKTGDKKEQ